MTLIWVFTSLLAIVIKRKKKAQSGCSKAHTPSFSALVLSCKRNSGQGKENDKQNPHSKPQLRTNHSSRRYHNTRTGPAHFSHASAGMLQIATKPRPFFTLTFLPISLSFSSPRSEQLSSWHKNNSVLGEQTHAVKVWIYLAPKGHALQFFFSIKWFRVERFVVKLWAVGAFLKLGYRAVRFAVNCWLGMVQLYNNKQGSLTKKFTVICNY